MEFTKRKRTLPEVVSFNNPLGDGDQGLRRPLAGGSKSEYKQFMLKGEAQTPAVPLTRKEADEEAINLLKDRELDSILKDPQLIRKCIEESVPGNPRKKAIKERLVDMGVRKARLSRLPNHRYREVTNKRYTGYKKELEVARESGNYTKALHDQLQKKHHIKPKVKSQPKVQPRVHNTNVQERSGELRVSKDFINSINGSGH
ncbi:hypothetical protein IWQ60_003662 [Tieghemiomyces parasiticus]|uniref:Uncharacterized protein n=1 Tax=Tieghemiomyces parasiticus TaxID=78921 RepID=A0A9W8DUK8_9FUNG|nr:hypothetical protein IWQ60_003662 [Tieghemiomyces parasiticus]